jgi:PAS domain S-box-containing protein
MSKRAPLPSMSLSEGAFDVGPMTGSPSDARERLLPDPMTDYAIYMLDCDGYIISWNPEAQRSMGYAADEILSRHFSCFHVEEDRHTGVPAQSLREAAARGRSQSEGWRLRKDGSRFWARTIIDPITDTTGALAGFATITRDLTERRGAEDALRRSEQQFRLLVQGVTDYAIFMLDPNGRVSSWNAGAQRIKGYTPDEIIGQDFSRFYTEEDRAAGLPRQSLEHARREGRFEKEGWRVRSDGSRFIAHVVIDAIRDDRGELVGFAKITRDVTERKRAQESLEHAQQALFQAQKLESLGQLTGGIAHDFNNLLTAILGSLESLRKRVAEDPRAQILLENAIHGAERGSTLTQRMLAFARRQELKISAIALPELVGGMMELLARSIGPTITIDARFPETLAPVRTDANQLETALLNLAVNARDAMPDGGSITLTARQENLGAGNQHGLQPGAYVCLSVIDTGCGMDAETLAHATEPFFTTKGVGKGTGLGLSMVQGLLEQSGGKLGLASQPGRGSTIEIWLPASDVPAQPAAQAAPGLAATSAHPGEKQRVFLIVDDDDLVLVSTCALLEDLGYTVLPASSGMRALELIAQNPNIDLVLTDQAMPGMTGLQLHKAIGQLRPSLPVILATGYAELPGSVPANLRRLSKPYRVPELIEALAATRGGAVPPAAT